MLQVIKAEDVRDGEPRMYAFDAEDADRRVVDLQPWELHKEKIGGYQLAIVDRPAPHSPPMPGPGAPRDPARIDPIADSVLDWMHGDICEEFDDADDLADRMHTLGVAKRERLDELLTAAWAQFVDEAGLTELHTTDEEVPDVR